MEALDKFSERNVEVCETVTKRDDVIKTLMRFVRGRNIRVKMAACSLLSNLSVMVPEAVRPFQSLVPHLPLECVFDGSDGSFGSTLG